MAGYHSDGEGPITHRRARLTAMPATPANLKTLDGQHLLVRPEVPCDGCEAVPKRPTLINWRGRLLCGKCYRKEAT